MAPHQVVSRAEWIVARKAHLQKEKELTRLRDELSRQRRELPWVKVDTPYVFDGPEGQQTLADLFDGRSQLIVQHFMFGPEWKEGCVGCSFSADHVAGALAHLEHHGVTLVAVSRAPFPELDAFKRRMRWPFKWVSSYGTTFNQDYHVSFTDDDVANGQTYYNYRVGPAQGGTEASGHSVFYRNESGNIFHTYSVYSRGDEHLIGTYGFLDMTPEGRNETGPGFNLTDWVRHHDKYGEAGKVDPTGRYRAAERSKCGCESVEVRQ
jgi:predicted dithiol-disulfide oxidoreductase (DUF899 family)